MGNYQYGILDSRFLLDADGLKSDPKNRRYDPKVFGNFHG